MKLAIVVGGWHWPLEFFNRMALQGVGIDRFVIAHRNPELAIVREEKREILAHATGPLADMDRILYRAYPSVKLLRAAGWQYQEEPNTIGDWGFFNQWLATHDYRKYDAILNCHDDNWIRRYDLMNAIEKHLGPNLLLSNGKYPQAPAGYVRGSFEVWRRELLDLLGGKIDLGDVQLTREGKTDSPEAFGELMPWNDINVPLRNFMRDRGLVNEIGYLSPHYRVSPWVIEGERGFLHKYEAAPWSFSAGLASFPLQGSTNV